MFRNTILSVLAGALMLHGQMNSGCLIFPTEPAFTELKKYLALTDTQLDQLREIMQDRDRAAQEVYAQIQAKQVELNGLLESGSADVARMGQLTLDIHNLTRQPRAPSDQYRQRAVAVLTPDQRAKVPSLDQALKLAPTAYQAVTLNLLDSPAPGGPITIMDRTEQAGVCGSPAPGVHRVPER